MSAMRNQTGLPISTDFCTIAYAAELCGVSVRTIDRLTKPDGDKPATLQRVTPLCGSRESSRHKSLLYLSQVREYAAARQLVRRG